MSGKIDRTLIVPRRARHHRDNLVVSTDQVRRDIGDGAGVVQRSKSGAVYVDSNGIQDGQELDVRSDGRSFLVTTG